MEKIKNELKQVYGSWGYGFLLILTAACSYGFKVTHVTIGIDDTPYAYYFEEGLAAVVGRWVLFVLNKFVALSEFAPFLTDFVAVLILMAAVTVWGMLFYRVLGDRVPCYVYWCFSCIFLSCPLIAEVFTYFLHNGIAIGYLFCGISLHLFYSAVEKVRSGLRKGTVLTGFVLSAVCLVVALGCYESFMIVWLVGILAVYAWEESRGKIPGERPVGVLTGLCLAAITGAAAMVLRSLILKGVMVFFHLEGMKDEAVRRSVSEMLGWIFEPGAKAEFGMILKRLFVQYGVFGLAYLPIAIFVIASLMMLIWAVWKTFQKKNVWCFLLTVGCFAAAFLLSLVEGKATLYRSAQFLPLICGAGFLAFAQIVLAIPVKKAGAWVIAVVAAVVIWNQCADLNHWFYVDYCKYEYTKDYMLQIAEELETHFDTDKPVLFTGNWDNPRSLVADAYVEYGSETFYRMKRITDLVDEHLLEKFYRNYGVWVAQTPTLTVVSWGKYAFETDAELIRFLEMHGHSFRALTDTSLYEEAEQYALELPSFPKEGSIVDRGDYILVHF